MTFLSLFAGIGGLDLGLERAGMRCVGQVEIDPFCRRVLAKHWPDVPKFTDVREFNAGMLNEKPDLICGGFPCQDISNAGKRAGIDGERSGLWSEFYRIICEIRPRYVLVENVSALLIRGIGRVLGDLAEGGFYAEWECLPAFAFGADHFRDRVFIAAYVVPTGLSMGGETAKNQSNARIFGAGLGFACGTETAGLERRGAARWCGNVHGIPDRVDRIKGLGNAVVPQVAEWIGRRILAAHESERAA